MQLRWACGSCPAFDSNDCRGWPTFPNGRRPVKPHFGPRGPSLAPTRPIAGPQSVRDIMAERNSWTGSAAELWRAGAHRSSHDLLNEHTGWPKSPRALAGRLRRAQTFSRALGIDIAFSREGRAGRRIIRIRATQKNTVSTVSTISSVCDQPSPRAAGEVFDDDSCSH